MVLCVTQVVTVQASSEMLVDPFAVNWRYLDDGSNQGTAWRASVFDDSAWKSGVANFGYGYGDETTVINGGPIGAHFITSYYRHEFNVSSVSRYTNLTLQALRDDGIVVYINGKEVLRDNMPAGAIAFDTPAGSEETSATSIGTVISADISKNFLQKGSNTIAVEIHQASADSPDTVFALLLSANYTAAGENIFSRDAYLQMITPTSAVVRWDTINKTNSVVYYGTDANNLDKSVKKSKNTHHHKVKLKHLDPATTYYYSIGSDTETLGVGKDYFFKTQPPVGTHPPTRLWVIGDSGRGNQGQRDVYKGYKNFAGNHYTDLWLMLGDNAYYNGTYQEYQSGFFTVYPELLHQTVVMPTLGNHDAGSVNTPAQTGPYYENFTLPSRGEMGGVASGTEAYYSYNYGNIHFVVLAVSAIDLSPAGAMAQWLEADLAANTADWIIAYWHHPPYTKGTHDSDTEVELIEMRENILPILEQHGTDLVLTGHSHNYERSKFVQGHYGYSNTYNDASFALDIGSGDVSSGDQAYTKAHPAIAHGGTVYAVAGTSSAAEGGPMNHPVMYKSFSKLGSMIIDIDNLALSAKFIDDKGDVQDEFTIQKLSAGADRDGDGILNAADNCVNNANIDQRDADNDGLGDICDGGIDTDGDTVSDGADTNDDNDTLDDTLDNCPLIANDNQMDYDSDGRGDVCDPVPMSGVNGAAHKDKAGYAVAFAGDVNADGYGDYVIGIPAYDLPVTPPARIVKNAGRAIVISGRTSEIIMALNGVAANDAAGFAVAGNSDIDNDGFADVIIGAPKADDIAAGFMDAGSATVLFGPNGNRKEIFYGVQEKSLAGASVALGDVNNDSHADMIIGAPNAGSVVVRSGDGYAVLNTFYASNVDAHAGASVASADLNNDGDADIIIGAPDDDDTLQGFKHAGSVTAYDITGNQLLKKYGAQSNAYFGKSVAGSDVNNDGYDDVLVGATGDNNGTLKAAGSVTVFSGSDGAQLTRKLGASAKANLGNSVASGNVNGDAFNDIIAGSWKDDKTDGTPLRDTGGIFVWSGNNYVLLSRFFGSAAHDYFGAAVSAGDIDGDGKDDVLIGVPGAAGLPTGMLKDAGAVQIKSGAGF